MDQDGGQTAEATTQQGETTQPPERSTKSNGAPAGLVKAAASQLRPGQNPSTRSKASEAHTQTSNKQTNEHVLQLDGKEVRHPGRQERLLDGHVKAVKDIVLPAGSKETELHKVTSGDYCSSGVANTQFEEAPSPVSVPSDKGWWRDYCKVYAEIRKNAAKEVNKQEVGSQPVPSAQKYTGPTPENPSDAEDLSASARWNRRIAEVEQLVVGLFESRGGVSRMERDRSPTPYARSDESMELWSHPARRPTSQLRPEQAKIEPLGQTLVTEKTATSSMKGATSKSKQEELSPRKYLSDIGLSPASQSKSLSAREISVTTDIPANDRTASQSESLNKREISALSDSTEDDKVVLQNEPLKERETSAAMEALHITLSPSKKAGSSSLGPYCNELSEERLDVNTAQSRETPASVEALHITSSPSEMARESSIGAYCNEPKEERLDVNVTQSSETESAEDDLELTEEAQMSRIVATSSKQVGDNTTQAPEVGVAESAPKETTTDHLGDSKEEIEAVSAKTEEITSKEVTNHSVEPINTKESGVVCPEMEGNSQKARRRELEEQLGVVYSISSRESAPSHSSTEDAQATTPKQEKPTELEGEIYWKKIPPDKIKLDQQSLKIRDAPKSAQPIRTIESPSLQDNRKSAILKVNNLREELNDNSEEIKSKKSTSLSESSTPESMSTNSGELDINKLLNALDEEIKEKRAALLALDELELDYSPEEGPGDDNNSSGSITLENKINAEQRIQIGTNESTLQSEPLRSELFSSGNEERVDKLSVNRNSASACNIMMVSFVADNPAPIRERIDWVDDSTFEKVKDSLAKVNELDAMCKECQYQGRLRRVRKHIRQHYYRHFCSCQFTHPDREVVHEHQKEVGKAAGHHQIYAVDKNIYTAFCRERE